MPILYHCLRMRLSTDMRHTFDHDQSAAVSPCSHFDDTTSMIGSFEPIIERFTFTQAVTCIFKILVLIESLNKLYALNY